MSSIESDEFANLVNLADEFCDLDRSLFPFRGMDANEVRKTYGLYPHWFEGEIIRPDYRGNYVANHIYRQLKVQYKNLEPRFHDLTWMFDLPTELIYEIFERLHPFDLYTFIRTTKDIRAFLLSRRASGVWAGSFARHPDIPSCPLDVSYPKWVSLMFGPSSVIYPYPHDYQEAPQYLKSDVVERSLQMREHLDAIAASVPGAKERYEEFKLVTSRTIRGKLPWLSLDMTVETWTAWKTAYGGCWTTIRSKDVTKGWFIELVTKRKDLVPGFLKRYRSTVDAVNRQYLPDAERLSRLDSIHNFIRHNSEELGEFPTEAATAELDHFVKGWLAIGKQRLCQILSRTRSSLELADEGALELATAVFSSDLLRQNDRMPESASALIGWADVGIHLSFLVDFAADLIKDEAEHLADLQFNERGYQAVQQILRLMKLDADRTRADAVDAQDERFTHNVQHPIEGEDWIVLDFASLLG
ncbi:hypothetical protein NLJ89_g885 [Agrocybe chaxingu]|uniref:F-box domain-containing protein n=1 Tax=Agrocybe chaxingu TaxID=84603 RepID=A0A9W8TE74_9AGAR|nr:hypothetical protein NLJ89_g885 [Agrocybe chaxingu]